MIDLHCHILPGVDDGADSLGQALEMARIAADSGLRTVVATPHCNLPWEESENFAGTMVQPLALLRQAVKAAQIPLELLPGGEIFCTPDFPDLLEQRKLQTLADSRYLLMEFYFDESPEFMEICFQEAFRRGYIPVAAHPERYDAVYRDPELVPRWFRRGCIIQLNKGSILGRLGNRAETVSRHLLERGFAHAVASDAHSPNARTPHMTRILRHLEDTYAPGYARILLSRNPERIIQNQNVLNP